MPATGPSPSSYGWTICPRCTTMSRYRPPTTAHSSSVGHRPPSVEARYRPIDAASGRTPVTHAADPIGPVRCWAQRHAPISDYFDNREAIEHLPRLREIYQRHWLRRALAGYGSGIRLRRDSQPSTGSTCARRTRSKRANCSNAPATSHPNHQPARPGPPERRSPDTQDPRSRQ
jgi:hypothetical protein